RLTQMSLISKPSGNPSSNGVQLPEGGVIPAAGVMVPRKAPTSVTARTTFASLGSKTAPVTALVGNAVAPVPAIEFQVAPVSMVKKIPLLVAAMARAGLVVSTVIPLAKAPSGRPVEVCVQIPPPLVVRHIAPTSTPM